MPHDSLQIRSGESMTDSAGELHRAIISSRYEEDDILPNKDKLSNANPHAAGD